jgi:hypothetical protein
MKTRNLMLALALALALPAAASAQTISYNPRTGDVWTDSQLGYYNDYGRNYRDNYVDDIVSSYGAPRYLVNELLNTRKWNPGDVYYACALAYQTRRSCSDVVNMYEQDRGQGQGQGWGAVAHRLGIKPGSAEFHALKGQMGKSRTRYTTYSSAHVLPTNGPGNSGKAKGKDAVYAPLDDGGPGNSGKAKGNSGGKGNSGAKGNGGGKGNGKGH